MLRFWTSAKDERGWPLAFCFLTPYKGNGKLRSKKRLLRAMLPGETSMVIPVADKKWKGKL
jgi:hypothetical protein